MAATTLLHHLPHFEGMIRRYGSGSFHPPMLPGLPGMPEWAGWILIPTRWILAVTLLLGLFPRLSAGLLAASGFYIFLLDSSHYSNTAYFHLILLGLLACPNDRGQGERLIRIQMSIVFFYSVLEKCFSPFWGASGLMLRELAAQRFWPAGIHWGGVGLAIIGLEFFLAVALWWAPFQRIGAAAGIFFAVALEMTMRPALFSWDLLACWILLLPARPDGRLCARLPPYGLLGALYLAGAVLRFWKPGFLRFF